MCNSFDAKMLKIFNIEDLIGGAKSASKVVDECDALMGFVSGSEEVWAKVALFSFT